jgi:hypothetical protein
LLEQMHHHRSLVESQANLSEFHEARQARIQARLEFKAAEERESIWRKHHVLTWLSAVDPEVFQDKGRQARSSDPTAGHWLLQRDVFRIWCNPQSGTAQTLWLNGMPGAGKNGEDRFMNTDVLRTSKGKTVLTSVIIDHLQHTPGATVLYFYLRQDDAGRNTFTALARSLLHQALRYDDGLLIYLFDEATIAAETHLHSSKLAEKLLDTTLKALGKIYIVIDGLDECAEDAQRHIATWFKRFVEESASGQQQARCLFSSQDDQCTRSLLQIQPTITVRPEDNAKDIQHFCSDLTKKLLTQFSLTDGEARSIAQTTTARASGKC